MSTINKLNSILEELKKALTASTTSNLRNRRELETTARPFEIPSDITHTINMNYRINRFEPAIVKSERVQPEEVLSPSETFDSCNVCGYVMKSGSSCTKCSHAASITEALPYHKR